MATPRSARGGKVRVNVRGFDDSAARATAVKLGKRAVRRLPRVAWLGRYRA